MDGFQCLASERCRPRLQLARPATSALPTQRNLAALQGEDKTQLRALIPHASLLIFAVHTDWHRVSAGQIQMTNSASTIMAILFGLAVFAVIVAVGWRSVQNRRILRLQNARGQETIIVADEGDDVSSVVTNTETTERQL